MKKALILLAFLFLSGCAGMKIYYDEQGRVKEIRSTGIFPGKRKSGENEIDTKVSLFDFNFLKGK